MRLRKALPPTSPPSVGDFPDAYREPSHKAESILCITLTGLQSKTFEAAMVARDKAQEVMPNLPIEVIDSRAVAGALGFVVLEAAPAARQGARLAQAARVSRK